MELDPIRWGPPVAIAHRGSRLMWPENTMEAFGGAISLGYRHIETDLHVTSDGIVVCIHDATVDRTTNGTGPVEGLSLGELQELDAGYRHSTSGEYAYRGRGLRVPTFEEVVTSFPDVTFVVDMKTDGMTEPLASLIDRLGLHERLIVGAFSDDRLEEFRMATGGTVATSTGPTLARLWVISSRVGRGAGGSAQALQLPIRLRGVRVVDPRLVKAAHAAGLQVHVWTVNDRDEMERLLEMGVDGIVTDRPDVLRGLLMERGEWES